jgi:PIN domain nuclease of toxin-antitoxin system
VNYLLDPHTLVWTLVDPDKLPGPMRRLLEDRANRVWFSAVSICEITINHSLGRDEFSRRAGDHLEGRPGDRPRGTGGDRRARGVNTLRWLHRDPFDRLLVA